MTLSDVNEITSLTPKISTVTVLSPTSVITYCTSPSLPLMRVMELGVTVPLTAVIVTGRFTIL